MPFILFMNVGACIMLFLSGFLLAKGETTGIPLGLSALVCFMFDLFLWGGII